MAGPERAEHHVWLLVLTLAAGCSDPAPRCEDLGSSSEALSAPARYLVGEAVALPRDPSIREREALLRDSQRARRELGWSLAAQVLSPVEVEIDGLVRTVPRFSTWYDREDLRRVFRHADAARSPEARAARAPFTMSELDEGFAWNAQAVLEAAAWPDWRLAEYEASIDSVERERGLGGIERTIYDPRAARHLLSSYSEILACRDLAPGPLDAAPDGDAPLRELRETAELEACETRAYGPFFVAAGGRLRATLDGAAELSAAAPNELACDGTSCEIVGPARVELMVRARRDTSIVLDLSYEDGSSFYVPCLDGAFPDGSLIIKADYRRVGFGFEVAVHDTSGAAIDAIRGDTADWGAGVGLADPGADEIYTVELPTGERYRLVALHIMLKELDHWVWVTLFWSTTPDADFGADRVGLGGMWAAYSMCVATAFVEGDPDPTGGALDPSLAAALEAGHDGAAGPSWCSNPYLEEGPGNASTNCIGCHQHAGSNLTAEEILAEDGPFRFNGRELDRTNFPTDYAFTATDLGGIFLEP